jgi:hypothetical protein
MLASFLSVPCGKLRAMLSEQDIDQLHATLQAGKPATVWFTAKAVGVTAGKSGKVLSFGEPAEGDFIEVRPTGAKDALSFSPAELTVIRPKPQPAAPKSPAANAPEPHPAAPASASEPEVEIYQPAPVEEEEKPKPVVRKSVARRSKPPVEVTVTLHATPLGEWTVEVQAGMKRSVKPTPVSAAAVARAARELPEDVEYAISSVLDEARRQHEDRVAQLEAELEAARRALEELS